jgi:hypothetical protein
MTHLVHLVDTMTIALIASAKGLMDMLKAPGSIRTPKVVKPV